MRRRIPILEHIAALASQHADKDIAIRNALDELDECEKKQRAERAEYLKRNGITCPACKRVFAPLPGSYSAFCSIGCQFHED